MSRSQTHIVIAGGGTAGWMAAALLSSFGARGYRVTLVESEEIGTVGVGEATIPQINLFNQALGLDEDDFVRETQATYKLGIEFVDWSHKGSRYMHAFGDVGRDIGIVPFQHYWHRARELGVAGELGDYSLNEIAARAGKMQRGPLKTTDLVSAMPYAFHFDAMLYAAYLRRFAEARGVTRIEGRIADAPLDGETGNIRALTLADGREIAGDLFIDCSGFRGLLIEGALGTGYEDWSNFLPANSAMAVPCASGGGPTPYTRSTAREAGWQWRIPLQHRIGNGYVFCDAFTTPDAVRQTLLANLDGEAQAEPRLLRFVTGRRAKFWNRNVVALGLASGFMEPLESTSIHLVQSGLSRLIRMLPEGPTPVSVIDEYNRQTGREYEAIRDFLVLHYKATTRDDTPFWRHCSAMAMPDSLAHKIELFREAGHIFRASDDLFTEVGWLQVLVGQGIVPQTHHPLADGVEPEDLKDYMETWEALMRREARQMPEHGQFLASHGAARAA